MGNVPAPVDIGAGLPTDLPPPTIRLIANHAELDTQARGQLYTTAERLPGILAAVGMPDLHPGSSAGFPVGATIVSHPSVIYPPLIGGDIGCGMALFRTGIKAPAEGQAGLAGARRLAAKIRGVEGAYAGEQFGDEAVTAQTWLDDAGVSLNSLDHASFSANLASIGTIGGGNHFAELQAIHEIRDAEALAQYYSAEDLTSNLFLLVHSGSRGVGQDILTSTRPEAQKGTVPLVAGTDEFETYMNLHDDACRWARCNRELIAHRILSSVDSSYSPNSLPGDDENSALRHVSDAIKIRKIVDIWHNVSITYTYLVLDYKRTISNACPS